jgi:nucleoside-diphosphate-sugar epimerase
MPADRLGAMPTAIASEPVHVIGASGRSGAVLVRALLARGIAVFPVVRDPRRWQAVAPPPHPLLAPPLLADLTDGFALRRALGGASRIVSTAHARTTPWLLAEAPATARLVLLGSTRRYTRWLDTHGEGVLRGETAFVGSGRPGVMLHPTMIFGAQGEDNVRRLAALLRRLPVVPLPGGGRALVQPIHQDDLSACILSALDVPWTEPATLVVAGAAPVRYADFVRAIATAAGLPPPRIVPVPAGLLMALAPLASRLPGLRRVSAAEIRRLTEDKAFDIAPMLATLGVKPMSLREGLCRTFAPHG